MEKEKIEKNKYYISFISCRLCSSTEDQITVAQIFINGDKVFIEVSENKMKLLKKILKPNTFNLFKYAIYSYKKSENELTYSDICRLNIYQNGLIKTHKPKPIALEILETDKNEWMHNHFLKFVDSYFNN